MHVGGIDGKAAMTDGVRYGLGWFRDFSLPGIFVPRNEHSIGNFRSQDAIYWNVILDTGCYFYFSLVKS